MARDHLDVLQNIEFSIVSTYRRCPDIDDNIVASALKTTIAEGESSDKFSSLLINDLKNTRLMRADVPDAIWTNCLKVVLWSVHNHSDAKPGDKDYLEFVQDYVI